MITKYKQSEWARLNCAFWDRIWVRVGNIWYEGTPLKAPELKVGKQEKGTVRRREDNDRRVFLLNNRFSY